MTWVEPFRTPHLLELSVQERHAPVVEVVAANILAVHGHMVGPWSWTVRADDGRALACCGVLEATDGTWAVLSGALESGMVALTRYTKRVLDTYYSTTGRRPTADVDEDHPEAVRWVELLGFRRVEPGLWEYHA